MADQLELNMAVRCGNIESRNRIIRIADVHGIFVPDETRGVPEDSNGLSLCLLEKFHLEEYHGLFPCSPDNSNYDYISEDEFISRIRGEYQPDVITESSSPTPEMGPVEGTMEHWRFLFAGQAMQGILANGEFLKFHKDVNVEQTAIKYADALIAELKKGKP